MNKKIVMGILSLVLSLSLAACGNSSKSDNTSSSSHKNIKMDNSSGVPKGMKAESSKYEFTV